MPIFLGLPILEIKLSEISISDLGQIQLIDQACLGGFWSLQAYAEEIARPNSHLIAIKTKEHFVLGFGCLWSIMEEAHITMLAVRPEYQKLGLGQYLVWGLLNIARNCGLEWATLEVRASNLAAIALYQKFDFQIIGKRPKYYAVTQEDALVMWRKGLAEPIFLETLTTWQLCILSLLKAKGWKVNT